MNVMNLVVAGPPKHADCPHCAQPAYSEPSAEDVIAFLAERPALAAAVRTWATSTFIVDPNSDCDGWIDEASASASA